MLFRTQAEMYRTYHMRDPESYYNRADLWDLATFTSGQQNQPEPVPPTYMIATLPGETEPEFLLMVPFTPREQAQPDRHDGGALRRRSPGRDRVSGPAEAGDCPGADSGGGADQSGSEYFKRPDAMEPAGVAGAAEPDSDAADRPDVLYVAPIYIQASQASMPQLKKVALVVGNNLVYTDTYEEALAQLEAEMKGQTPPAKSTVQTALSGSGAAASPAAQPSGDPRVEQIREHLKRYQDLAAQGKWADAGRELEAIEGIVKK